MKNAKAFSLFLACLILFCGDLTAKESSIAVSARPRLIVILVGDQVRADYFERYHRYLAPDGLRRFRDEGLYFAQAARDDAVLKTSPGHVLIGSGLYARTSGIVNNDWYDALSSRTVSAAELIPGKKRTQLRWFEGKSLARRFHQAFPHGRFISISLKDRGALLLGGPDQDEAYWWDLARLKWVSYHPALPWLDEFNQQDALYAQKLALWEPLVVPDAAEQKKFQTAATLLIGHLKPEQNLGADFPHPLFGFAAVMASPYGDDLTEQLAERAMAEWHLGASPKNPDILTVSFSEVDLVGHQFGPDSQEVMDAFLRLDRDVAKFMQAVHKKVGSDVVWVFSSDHGVTSFPEIARTQGRAAGRVPFSPQQLPHPDWIASTATPFIYLNTQALESAGVARADAAAILKTELLRREGMKAVYSAEDLLSGKVPPELMKSFYRPGPGEASRCGDLWVVLKPGYIFSDGPFGTTHGQPTAEDQRIPLGFYGAGIPTAVSRQVVSPAVIAPTLLSLLQIPAPDLAGPATF